MSPAALRPLVVLVAIAQSMVLTACGVSSTSHLNPTPQSTASAASAAPSPTYPSASGGTLACRLPVSRPQVQPANPYFATGFVGGFLELPSGQYSDDAQSVAVVDPASTGSRLPNVYMTTASPVLRGSDATLSPSGAALTYDAAFARWLPVSKASVSPDGARYAYVDGIAGVPLPTSRVHIVDVKTGADHIIVFPGADLAQTTQYLAGVVAFSNRGIYLSLYGSNQGSGPDTGKLWLLDPDRGTIHKVSDQPSSEQGWLVTDEYAWTFASTLEASPVPTAGGSIQPSANRLVRLDLNSGQLTQWWVDSGNEPASSPGAATVLGVMGVDGAGSPIVEGVGEVGDGRTYTTVFDVWVIKAPNQALPLDVSAADGGSSTIRTSDGAITDSVGTWIAVNGILFHYGTDRTFRKVAEGPYSPSGSCV
jgi:hypothetical protein